MPLLPCRVRPLALDDVESAREIALQAIQGVPFADGATETLRQALATTTAEARMMVAERDGAVVGVGVFGAIAGTVGTAKLHLLGVEADTRRRGIGAALLSAIAHALRGEGAHLLLAEIPDDPSLGAYRDLLRAAGFVEESRVPDFYRDGVALLFLRRDLAD